MQIELANCGDMILATHRGLAASEVRHLRCEGIVDSRTMRLIIPGAAMDALGLEEAWQAKVRYADGSTAIRPVVRYVWLKLCGRESVFSAVVESNRDTALIGAIVLEALDLVVDCVTQQLHPRDPHFMVTEIE
jgi:hypothetical protein